MDEKKINARFTLKGDIEANWKKAVGFVPLDKEIIIYKPDENYSYSRIKVGDGVTGVNDLPFVTSQPDYLQNDPAAKDYIKNRPFYSEGEKTETVVDRDIIPLQEVEFTGEGMPEGILAYVGYTNLTPWVNKGQYNLTIDDTEYLITLTDISSDGSGDYVAGNLGLVGQGDDTGEPFYFGIFSTTEAEGFDGEVYQFGIAYQTTETTHTIGVSYVGDTAPIIPESTLTFSEEPAPNLSVPTGCTGIFFENLPIEKDSIYNISLNGNTYKNLTFSALPKESDSTIEGYYIGNLGFGNGADTGENYLITYFPSVNWTLICTSLPAGEYTFSLGKVLPTTTVTTEIIHKIDPKFVPQADYLQNDPNGEGYIKNRPFYSKITYNRAIVPLQDMEFFSESTLPEGHLMTSQELDNVASIANGGQYELIIDGTTYPIILKNRTDLGASENIFFAGNFSLMPGSEEPDTKESYLIMVELDGEEVELFLAYKSTATTHKVGLSYVGDTVPLILEDEYDFIEVNDDFTYYMKPFPYGMYFMGLQENDVFNVTFNGKSYTNLTWKNNDDFPIYLGNTSLFNAGEDTGEDWLFTIDSDEYQDVVFVTREAGPHTLSLEKASLPFTEIVHKIDSKYLDIDVEVPYTEDDKGNVTFKNDVKTSNGASLNSTGNRINQINSQLTSIETKISDLYNTQVDYNQNSTYEKDYIKNRPFYIEKRSNNYTKTIYESNKNNNPYISYDTTNFIYTATVQAPDSFVNNIVDGINIEIKQGVTPPDESYNHYFNRTSKVFSDGNNKYAGNLYLFTKNRNDNTSEDYLFYYNRDTNQFSLYFLNTVRTEEDFSLSQYLNQLDKTYLKISIHSEDGVFYHQIDEKFLPDNKKLADKKINTITQDYVILTDIDSGLEYAIQIKNGNLVTSEMPSGIKITSLPNKINYARGGITEIDLTGLVVSAIIGDAEKEITNYTCTKLKTPFLETGEVEIIVIAELYKKIYSTSFTINIIEFNAETELIDFDYTENDDGTYTLTGWKQTLNGESSTELIVPNNILIKI